MAGAIQHKIIIYEHLENTYEQDLLFLGQTNTVFVYKLLNTYYIKYINNTGEAEIKWNSSMPQVDTDNIKDKIIKKLQDTSCTIIFNRPNSFLNTNSQTNTFIPDDNLNAKHITDALDNWEIKNVNIKEFTRVISPKLTGDKTLKFEGFDNLTPVYEDIKTVLGVKNHLDVHKDENSFDPTHEDTAVVKAKIESIPKVDLDPSQEMVDKINKNHKFIQDPLIQLLMIMNGFAEDEIRNLLDSDTTSDAKFNCLIIEPKWANIANTSDICDSKDRVQNTYQLAVRSLVELYTKVATGEEITLPEYKESCDAVETYENALKKMIEQGLEDLNRININQDIDTLVKSTSVFNVTTLKIVDLLSTVGAYERLEECYPDPFTKTAVGDPNRSLDNQEFINKNATAIDNTNKQIDVFLKQLEKEINNGTIINKDQIIEDLLNINPKFSKDHCERLETIKTNLSLAKTSNNTVIHDNTPSFLGTFSSQYSSKTPSTPLDMTPPSKKVRFWQ